jgi:molybdopterin-guanine dinucleotide biosynthesis protein A
MKTAGFVLTGGQSRRMGRDKALLPVGNMVLAEHVAETIAQVTEEVFLVGRPERYTGLRWQCLPDVRPDLGPLSGLEAALAAERGELNFVASCDLAGLQASWITALLQRMDGRVRCAAAVDRNGKRQPLCAVYRSDCLETVTRALDERRLKAMDLLDELAAVSVPLDAVIANLNTPQEFEEWAKHG